MTQTEQGEFELVLGNKQLLSVFFIVVVLLAVFFFMGYVVGRNSGPASALAHNNNAQTSTLARPSPMSQAPPPTSSSSPNTPSDTQANSTEPPPSTAPDVQPTPSHPAETAPAEEQAAGPQLIAEPPGGTTWLQVVATTRPDAELIAETLGKRHFKTQVAPAPNGLFRVLVGPAKSASEASELRTRLESDGFKNPIVRKY